MAIRVSGLASGMDIDSMVKQLMDAEKLGVNKLKQQKQILEWKRDDYRSMNTLLADFRTKVLNMKLSTTYGSKKSSSTDESLVTATGNSSASNSSYQLSEVQSLATAAYLKSSKALSTSKDEKISANQSLLSSNDKFATSINWEYGSVETVNLVANGNEIDLNLSPNTFNKEKVIVKVGGEMVTGYSIDDNGKITLASPPASGAAIEVTYVTNKKVEEKSLAEGATGFLLSKRAIAENSLTFTINGKDISVDADGKFESDDKSISGDVNFATGQVTLTTSPTEPITITAEYQQKYTSMDISTKTSNGAKSETFLFTADQTLSNITSKINSSKLGLTMFYDSSSDQISVTRKETGNFDGQNDIQIGSSSLAAALQLYDLGSSKQVDTISGTNASFMINGITTERTSNTFTIDGVTFNLKQTFTAPVTVGITSDTSAVYDNIKSFIDSYNDIITAISAKTTETRNRNYQPLSEEERSSLSENEVEKWDKIAKAGWLQNDATLKGLLSSMRYSMSNPVASASGNFKTLSSIGIATTSNYLEGGKLEINEAKLKQALEEDPDSVQALFTSADGLMSRLQDNIKTATDKIKTKAGSSFSTNATFTLGRDLTNVEDRITRFEDRLVQIENRYYAQFTAMEKAIQNANSQSGYLSSMFMS